MGDSPVVCSSEWLGFQAVHSTPHTALAVSRSTQVDKDYLLHVTLTAASRTVSNHYKDLRMNYKAGKIKGPVFL